MTLHPLKSPADLVRIVGHPSITFLIARPCPDKKLMATPSVGRHDRRDEDRGDHRILTLAGAFLRGRQNQTFKAGSRVSRAGRSDTHTTATLTLWIGGSESNRQSHCSPPSLPI